MDSGNTLVEELLEEEIEENQSDDDEVEEEEVEEEEEKAKEGDMEEREKLKKFLVLEDFNFTLDSSDKEEERNKKLTQKPDILDRKAFSEII